MFGDVVLFVFAFLCVFVFVFVNVFACAWAGAGATQGRIGQDRAAWVGAAAAAEAGEAQK